MGLGFMLRAVSLEAASEGTPCLETSATVCVYCGEAEDNERDRGVWHAIAHGLLRRRRL